MKFHVLNTNEKSLGFALGVDREGDLVLFDADGHPVMWLDASGGGRLVISEGSWECCGLATSGDVPEVVLEDDENIHARWVHEKKVVRRRGSTVGGCDPD